MSWESVDQTDIGVEYGFLNNRISGEIDYYSKVSKDLLFDNPLPGTSGFSSIRRNIGEMENSGVEFVLNGKIIQKEDFTLSASFNLAKNKNEVKNLPNEGADIISGQNIQREGEALNSFYLIEYAGVNPENGDGEFYVNGNFDPSNEDIRIQESTGRAVTTDSNLANRIVAGTPYAEWIGGLTSNLYFKGIDFSFTFQGEWGASLYNGGGVYQSANGDYFDNQTADQMNRWQQPGDITDVPQARLYAGNGVANSTRYLEDADFIRLRNLTLGPYNYRL